MSEHGQGRSWWTTLPGILTGVAALITALTGLLVAVLPLIKAQHVSPSTSQSAASSAPSSPGTSDGPRQGGRSAAPDPARPPAPINPAFPGSSTTSGTDRQPGGTAPLLYGETLEVAGTLFEVLKVETASPRTGWREIRVTFQVTAAPVGTRLARSNVRIIASGRVYTPIEGLPATTMRAGVRRQFWVRFEIEEPLLNPVLSFTDDMFAPRGEVRRGLALPS